VTPSRSAVAATPAGERLVIGAERLLRMIGDARTGLVLLLLAGLANAVAALLPEVRFLLIWRTHHLAKVERIVASAGVTNVVIRSGVVDDMASVYDSVHAAVLPGLEHRSFIPCPRSGLEALAHGKPLLLSHLVSLAPSVTQSGAGVAFEPTIDGLKAAILQLQAEYPKYQANTQRYVAQNFSPTKHLELYRRLYQSLG